MNNVFDFMFSCENFHENVVANLAIQKSHHIWPSITNQINVVSHF